jgi:hypothetical protein
MDPVIIGAVVIGAIALFMWSKKSKADTPVPQPLPPGPVDPAKPEPGPKPMPGPTLKAGATPQTAITSDLIPPGFSGYVRVSTGDNLSHIAQKASPLTGPAMSYWDIRNNPENAWLLHVTTPPEQGKYGLALYAVFGTNVGVDCELTPGWRARRYSHNTGQFPVLRVG